MPPPSLSTTTTVRSAGRRTRPTSADVSCRKARSPTSATVGRVRGERDPERGRHHPVDAVGPAVGLHPHPGARRAVPLEVPDGHGRRHHQPGVVGQLGQQRAGHPGFGRFGVLREHVVDRLLRGGLGLLPPVEPRGLGGGDAGDERIPPLARLPDDDAVEPAIGIDPRALLVDEQLGRAAVGDPRVEHPGGGGLAHPQHDLGPEPLGRVAVAQDGVGRPHRRPGGGAAAGPGVGEHRPAERGGQPVDPVGRPAAEPGHDHTGGAAELLDAERVVARRRGQARRGHRPGSSLGPAGTDAPRRRKGAGRTDQRLTEREVEVDRSRGNAGGGRDRPGAERTP